MNRLRERLVTRSASAMAVSATSSWRSRGRLIAMLAGAEDAGCAVAVDAGKVRAQASLTIATTMPITTNTTIASCVQIQIGDIVEVAYFDGLRGEPAADGCSHDYRVGPWTGASPRWLLFSRSR